MSGFYFLFFMKFGYISALNNNVKQLDHF